MRAKFRRKQPIFPVIKLLIIILVFIISFYFAMKLLFINIDNESVINRIMNSNENQLNSSNFIFKYAFGVETPESIPVINSDPIKDLIIDPVVYIYNSHPTEKYNYKSFEAFNINPTVLTASHILGEYLKEYDIYSYIETGDITEYIHANNWNYGDSYKASRVFLEKSYEKTPTLKYFIDIHRDSSSHEISTTTVNGNSCARFLFVIGLENENYEDNLKLVSHLETELKNIEPTLSRGILKKEGTGVNGVYNQDFHKNAILIEVGAQYNSIDEINCSLVYLAESLKKVIDSGEY